MGGQKWLEYEILSWSGNSEKKKEFIKGIRDRDGVWQYDESVVSNIFVDFYTELFTSTNT